jgi:hypothetical protein
MSFNLIYFIGPAISIVVTLFLAEQNLVISICGVVDFGTGE